MRSPHDILTTGQVAKICNVAPRTVSKWFDSGQLCGYRIPGSKDRRIPVAQLIRFMKAHGMPLNGVDGYQRRVLIIDPDHAFSTLLHKRLEAQGLCAEWAACMLTAGMMIERLRPHAVIIDVDTPAFEAGHIAAVQRLNNGLQDVVLISIGAGLSDATMHGLMHHGFMTCLSKPFELSQLLEAIESAVPALD